MDAIDNPVSKTLASFANLCFEKGERAYFNRGKLAVFLWKNKKEYPLALQEVDFDTMYGLSNQVDGEIFNLTLSRLLCSYGPDFHPHEVQKGISCEYDNMPKEEKDYLQGLAKKMYDEVGCDQNGSNHKSIKSS